MKNEPDIRMVNVEALIEVLTILWDKGVDYVNMTGEKGKEADNLTFSFTKEYMAEEYRDEYDDLFNNESSEEHVTSIKLTDENLNDLL